MSRKHLTLPPPLSSQVRAYIISSLKKEMPNVFGKESKKKELVNNLGEIYQKIEREHQISPRRLPQPPQDRYSRPLCPGSRLVGIRMRTAQGTRGSDSGGNPGSTRVGPPKVEAAPPNQADPGEVDPGRDCGGMCGDSPRGVGRGAGACQVHPSLLPVNSCLSPARRGLLLPPRLKWLGL